MSDRYNVVSVLLSEFAIVKSRTLEEFVREEYACAEETTAVPPFDVDVYTPPAAVVSDIDAFVTTILLII